MGNSEFSYAKKGIVVRLVYLAIALVSFTIRRITRKPNGVVVLCYHTVSARQRPFFERQMRYIKKRVSSLDRIEGATDGDALVAVTFDDAFECLLDNVIPVVREYGVPVAIFAVTGNMGRSPAWLYGSWHPDANLLTMTLDQLKQLACEPGCLIGSHAASHCRLGDLSAKDVESELASSKYILEDALGLPCQYLALPHGSYRDEVIDLAIRHGYRKVLTLDEISLPSCWPAGTVGRFSASPDMWMVEFVLTVYGAYSWLYTWRNWVRRMKKYL